MKNAAFDRKTNLRGVSTLDLIEKNLRILLLLALIAAAFAGSAFGAGGHSTLDIVDPSFNPQIVANLYGGKFVQQVEVLPDGKILAFGYFSSYNRVPVGRMVRLNADGSLDPTFNNQTITLSDNSSGNPRIIIQSDGKIVLLAGNVVAGGQAAKNLLRFNSDGTLDTSFNYILGGPSDISIDSLGRLVLAGFIQTPQGNRQIIRLNGDGSLDSSFNFQPASTAEVEHIASQGNRLIVGGGNARIFRLNENGTEDTSFSPVLTTGIQLYALIVQPDNKILYMNDRLRRLNPNGDADASFQTSPTTGSIIKLATDGKIVTASSASNATFRRYLANGAVDTSFNQFTHPRFAYCFSIQSDGGIITGDQSSLNDSTANVNNFIRLTPGGVPDPAFNPGGLGFQNIFPGSIRAIAPQTDGKVLLGGKFDVINNVSRIKLARLNADSSVDSSFQVNTSGTGDYFSIIRDIYQIRTQSDGKIVVSGFFDYVQGGVTKRNFVRLNSDGSMDNTFDLSYIIQDYSEIVAGGRNHFSILSDGKLMVGTSKNHFLETSGPVKLTTGGARDTAFNPTINNQSDQMFIDDLAIQPDEKILIGGSHNPDFSGHKSFVARLNADGSTDSTFPYTEETGRLRTLLALLPSGKILVAKHSTSGTILGTVKRLNADGSADNTFNSLSIPGGIINALLTLPNGKIFVGGKFTVTVNGQQTRNLLRLDANGNIEPTTYDVNAEVLSLAVDGDGRLLVGGSFTVIDANGGAGANRTYIARLTDSPRFDFDGDGRADISVFRASENKWYILRSSDGQVTQQIFAVSGDVPVPADYDGDGKTDMAIYRPAAADWWSLSTANGNQVYADWGEPNVIARPSDFDGDGKSDYIFFLPSNSTWYRYGSSVGASYVTFGLTGDKPVTGDFDGDGKSDVAIFRPSTGDWWWQSSVDNAQRATHWGISTDIPAPADYDGDGKTDFAVYRPSNGTWYIYNSGSLSSTILNFGISEDKPVPADYDGDGKADIAVFRPSTGVWYLQQSTAGFAAIQFGVSTDIPLPNAFVP
jgi:uncharacterized delta-60 repeat protein